MAIPLNLMTDKINSYRSRIDADSIRNQIPLPTHYIIYINGYKNNEDPSKEVDLSQEILYNILEETAWTFPKYILTGSEPLDHPSIRLILQQIINRLCKCEIATDGLKLASIKKELFSSNIHVSVEVNLENLDLLCEQLKILSENRILYTENFSFVLSANQIKSSLIPSIIIRLKEHGCYHFLIKHKELFDKKLCEGTGRFLEKEFGQELYVSFPQYENNETKIGNRINDLLLLRKQLEMIDNIKVSYFPDMSNAEMIQYYNDGFYKSKGNDDLCLVPWISPIIDCYGNVKNCRNLIVGNIMKESFWSIWNSERNQRFRNLIALYDALPFCSHCKYRFIKIYNHRYE